MSTPPPLAKTGRRAAGPDNLPVALDLLLLSFTLPFPYKNYKNALKVLSAINNSFKKCAHDMKICGNLRATWKFAIPQFFCARGSNSRKIADFVAGAKSRISGRCK